MSNTPLTPTVALTRLRQYGERTKTWSTATYNDGTEKALHQIAVTLAAEAERLRKALSEATDQVAERDDDLGRASARIAVLEGHPVDEAAELAEGLAGLDAMRREHHAPCRVPDSPDCTCPAEVAYRSSVLPPRDALCACGHTGLDHHHGGTKCWAHLPRERDQHGTWGPIRVCECAAFTEPSESDDEGLSGPCDCGEGAVHHTAADCPADCPAEERSKASVSDERRLTGNDLGSLGSALRGHLFGGGRGLDQR